jgi:hypothetical protein
MPDRRFWHARGPTLFDVVMSVTVFAGLPLLILGLVVLGV